MLGKSIPKPDYYIDFTTGWYKEIGNAICIFVFASAFLNNVSYFFFYFIFGCRRAWDRGCFRGLKPSDGYDNPNTKKKRQEDLEELYTGRPF